MSAAESAITQEILMQMFLEEVRIDGQYWTVIEIQAEPPTLVLEANGTRLVVKVTAEVTEVGVWPAPRPIVNVVESL